MGQVHRIPRMSFVLNKIFVKNNKYDLGIILVFILKGKVYKLEDAFTVKRQKKFTYIKRILRISPSILNNINKDNNYEILGILIKY